MILLAVPIDWKSIKEQLADTNGFIDRLKNYKVMEAPEALFTKVSKNYLSKPEFNINDIKKKSVAASYMAMWVMAVIRY